MLPFLKSLHILPVKFRITFKIALLVFKCLKNCAPEYLQEYVVSRKPSFAYDFRCNADKFLIDKVLKPNYVKSQSAFSFSSVTVCL